MLNICVVRQKQALMDVMSRKSILDALAGYHPFWLSAALEVISFSFSAVMVLVLFPQLHAGLGYHSPPAEASALHEYTHARYHRETNLIASDTFSAGMAQYCGRSHSQHMQRGDAAGLNVSYMLQHTTPSMHPARRVYAHSLPK